MEGDAAGLVEGVVVGGEGHRVWKQGVKEVPGASSKPFENRKMAAGASKEGDGAGRCANGRGTGVKGITVCQLEGARGGGGGAGQAASSAQAGIGVRGEPHGEDKDGKVAGGVSRARFRVTGRQEEGDVGADKEAAASVDLASKGKHVPRGNEARLQQHVKRMNATVRGLLGLMVGPAAGS